MRTLFAAMLAAFTGMPATAQTVTEQAGRSVEQLIPLVKVTGDSLDPSIKVSTQNVTVMVTKGLIASTKQENSFLRAFIDKKTGKISAQVYHMTSNGRGWYFFTRASYEAPDGLKEVSADRIGSDVDCSRYGCTRYEDTAFDIDMAVLRRVAERHNATSTPSGIKYRLFGNSGENVDEILPSNEIAAFVRVIDRESAKFTPPSAPAPP